MSKILKILFIEDDVIEMMKFIRVLNLLNYNHEVIDSKNGFDAIQILTIKEIIPDIIILDLNMPKVNGIEFLTLLKNDELLKYIPAIILTTSNNPTDIYECYKIGIAGYIVKPLKYDDYVKKIQKTLEYWSVNELIINENNQCTEL
ncbi:response regulator [Flavobacterium luteum]|uniref:Response regulator n=1 Tax=Flavobacterium luteum TaxID=2026654 RepID=A0A7J5AIH3_9FLAO|nr:response regulator [Flavobacterium luteum]KAB1156809.1 response regulator [Flavobacterium luteum]